MTRPASPRAPEDGRAALRWTAAVAVALGLHAGVAALVIREARPEPLDAGGDAIAVEFDPVEGEAAKPDEVQPAVPADKASTAAAAAAPAEDSQATPPPVDTPPPVEPPPPDLPPPVQPPPPEPRPPAVPPPVASPPPPVSEPPSPSEAVPEVPPPPVAPTPERAPKPSEVPRAVVPPVQATQASAASAASAVAEDAAQAVRKLAAARETAWRGSLVPHLNRYRRFPPGVGSGTARVGFTIDGDGRVTAVSIVTGSGDAALDDAARALVQRASPFPAPPPGVSGRALSFVVPVHYDARHP